MSSEKSALPLNLKIRPSKQLAIFLLLSHGGAMAVLYALTLTPWVQWSLALMVIAYLVYNMRTHALLSAPSAIVEAVWSARGDWTLLNINGEALEARLLPNSYVHPLLVLLNFQFLDMNRVRSLVLPADSLDQQTYRKLRVRLNLEKQRRD